MPIPERPKDWKPKDAPDFVRFYMGRSLSCRIYTTLASAWKKLDYPEINKIFVLARIVL